MYPGLVTHEGVNSPTALKPEAASQPGERRQHVKDLGKSRLRTPYVVGHRRAEGRARLQRSSRRARASAIVTISCGGGSELGTLTAFNSTRLPMVISLLDLASQGLR